jgi:ABC-type transport system substrate-binding protein
MKIKRLAALLTAGALSILSFSGCFGIELSSDSTTGTSSTASDTDEVVVCRVGLASGITGQLMPGLTESGADDNLQSLLFGAENVSLVAENSYAFNTSVINASSITDGADGSRTYTFTLADGLCYSDGSALTAKDYVFSVLLRSAEVFAEMGGDDSTYRLLDGYDSYREGGAFSGVRLLSDSSFSLTIAAESLPSYQEMLLTQVIPLPMAVLAPDAVLTDDGSGAVLSGLDEPALRQNVAAYSAFPTVTAGPYMLTGVENGAYSLTCNPNYAGGYYKRQPSIENLCVETADLDNGGQYDLLVGLTGRYEMDAANRLLADGSLSGSLSYDSLVVSSIRFSDDVSTEIRQAIAKMIDPQEAAEKLAGHWGQEPLGNIPLASSLFSEIYSSFSFSYSGTDPIGADQLLEEAGNGETVILTYAYDPDDAESCALLELLEAADEQQSLLTIVPQATTDPALQALADLTYQKEQYSKSWAPWAEMNGTALEEQALQLQNTAYLPFYADRFEGKLLDFEEQLMEQLPVLPLAVYEAYDLYGKRLVGYRDVDVYDDWTIWIQYCRIVDLG